MKLDNKKRLAAKTLGVGLGRIRFDVSRIDEIKEAITKQDIRDLYENGAIKIREITGRKTKVKRNTRRRQGKIKKRVGKSKQKYVKITRKLRNYIKELKNHDQIEKEKYKRLRQGIRMREFRSKKHLKENL